MVSFCYTRLSETRISRVQVQKLDWSKKAWVKVAGLGVNRVFFIRWGQFGVSRAADELGLKGNCVYFTVPADKGLYVHDMEQGTTSVHDPGLNVPDSMEPCKPKNDTKGLNGNWLGFDCQNGFASVFFPGAIKYFILPLFRTNKLIYFLN